MDDNIFNSIENPTKEKTIEAEEKIKKLTEEYTRKFKKYSESFNDFRKFFKNNKDIFNHKKIDNDKLEEWYKKEEEFKIKKGQYNKEFEKVIKSLDEVLVGRKDYELKLLFYIQYSETTANRVQNRLQESSLNKRIAEIEILDKKLQKQEKNLKNIYIGFISFVSIFLSVFALVSGNINFFANVSKDSNLKEMTPLFLLVNAIILISVITMLYLVYHSLKLFSENKENKFPIIRFYSVPIIIIIIALFLIA